MIGTGVKKLRKLCGFSKADFAKKAGVKILDLKKFEKGEAEPNATQVALFAKALSIPAGCLRVFADTKSEDKDALALRKSVKKLILTVVTAREAYKVAESVSSATLEKAVSSVKN